VGIEPDNRGYETRATDKGYSQEYGRIQKTAYSHEAMIDLIIANPRITQNQLASEFGYSVGWVSRVMGSDAFQAALARRRDEVTDPFIIASLEEKFKGLVNQSVEILMNKLDATQSADLAIKTLDLGSKALGFGAREKNQTNVQNNFVVQLPPKAINATDWAERHSPEPPPAPSHRLIEARNMSTTVTRDPTVQPDDMKLAESQ
jgi:hypothetical protein